VRVAVEEALRLEANVPQCPADARLALVAGDPLDDQRLGDDRRDPLARTQRLVGVLEDHLHASAELSEALPAVDRLTVERNPAAGGLDETEHRTREGGFAAAGLADHPQDLPPSPLEGDAVNGARDAAAGAELHLEVAHLHQ
jgi:hypothetical protein